MPNIDEDKSVDVPPQLKSRYEDGCEGRLKLKVPNGGEREVCFSRGLLAISEDVFSYCNWRCSTGIWWIEAKNVVKHPLTHREVSPATENYKIIWPKMSWGINVDMGCAFLRSSVMSDSFGTSWTISSSGSSLSMGFLNNNTGVGCRFLFWEMYPSQGLNLCLALTARFITHWAIGEALDTDKCRYKKKQESLV